LQAFNLVDYNQIFINENLYSIRFDSLWVESLEPVKLPTITHDTIMDKDVILITGGLGGVGLAIANQISKKNKAIFILVSRTNLSDILEKTDYVNQQLTIIENIKSQNCLVDIKCIDITEPDQLNQLFDYIYKTYDKLSGIIHAAGLPPLSVYEKSYINVKASIRAKVYGASNLVNKIKNLDIKYFIMVSSLASIMGDINQIEYSAANSYLDYLSVSKNFPSGCTTIVINWCVWLDVGMLVYKKAQNNFKNIDFLVSNAIASNEASELFYNLIQQNTYSQIIVSKLDIELLKSRLFRTNTMLNVTDNRVDAENKVIEKNLPNLYYQVGDMFSNILGVKKVSIFEDFFELGGTSLSAIKLLAQLKAVGIRVTLADMSNLRTIDKICKINNSRKAVNIVDN
jgi:NADP-dependent 3-hydroxy acid dehydrogenase YdfG/aryl carrier-like protein